MAKKMSMKEIKKLAKSADLKNLTNPMELLDQVQGTDTVKQINILAKGIDDGIMMLQEHIMIVQKNQVHFQEYFEGIYNKTNELETKINNLENEIKSLSENLNKKDE